MASAEYGCCPFEQVSTTRCFPSLVRVLQDLLATLSRAPPALLAAEDEAMEPVPGGQLVILLFLGDVLQRR